jgi:hypothetical protein
MSSRSLLSFARLGTGLILLLSACTSSEVGTPGGGGQGTGGSSNSGVGGASSPTGNGGANPTTGAGGANPTTGAGGGAGGVSPTGAGGGTGGSSATGTGGAGGVAPTGAGGGAGSTVTPPPPLDCGPIGTVINNAGPPKNRVNYMILADGYTSTTVNTTLMTDVNNYLSMHFSDPYGQPYLRYKNFVNICLLKTVSQTDGISQTGASTNTTIFNCYGDDTSRLATCDTRAAQTQLTANTPAGMTVSWHSIVLNNSRWWNTGSVWMLWSGGNKDGPKGGMHEGGHGFHQLADEYGGTNSGCTTEYAEVNSTADMAMTAGKWNMWLGYNAADATGMQVATNTGFSTGSRYCNTGQYRPSDNSLMNSLFGTNKNTSWNSVSREQVVMTIWRYVTPIDSTVPAAGAVTNPASLTVNVIDPAVINVDWTVDGTTTTNGGTTLNTSTLAPGMHTISAKAYDNATMDLVRNRSGTCPASVTGSYCSRTAWTRSQQTVTWTVTKQ